MNFTFLWNDILIWRGPFHHATGAGGINLAAYNPTYAAALYGAAFGTSGSYDPTLYAASYPGLPTAFPAYSPGSAFATAAAAASAEYPRGAYALPYSPGREPSIHLPGMQGSQNKEICWLRIEWCSTTLCFILLINWWISIKSIFNQRF